MSRGQEGQVVNTANAQNKTDFSNAQNSYNQTNNSLNSEQGDIQDYKSQLSQYAAANPYGQGGAYQTAVNQSTANTADAASQATAQKEAGAAARTGQNAGQAVAGGQAAEEANTRNLMQTQAQNNASRISNQAGYNKGVLSASEVPATLQEGVTKGYSGLTSSQDTAANDALGTEQKAGMMPSEMETLQEDASKALDAYLSCPAEGSFYRMADGNQKRVETLKVGEWLKGIDGEDEQIEEIQSVISPILLIKIEDNYTSRVSRVHAYALPAGGFTEASHCLGRVVKTAGGPKKVYSVEWAGKARVFNVITGGSHTYCADGVWALGVGEAERQVTMKGWNAIGDNLAAQSDILTGVL
jgi:hypothetical protein